MVLARTAALLLLLTAPLRAADLPTNTEMTALFTADQKDRSTGPNIDWSVVAPADNARRARTQELLDAGALQSADDYYHAAFVFQHGNLADDYLKAHLLAMVAVARGKPEGNWIAAASLDRYLRAIGQPQVLGTQFMIDGTKATQQPYASTLIPDSLRAALGVRTLSQQEEQRLAFEKDAIANPRPAALSPTVLVQSGRYPWAPKASAVACRTIPGAEVLLAQKDVKWIVVGEQIGTQETPEMFADLVCQLSEQRPIAVALALPASAQRDVDVFIASDGGDVAKAAFKNSILWKAPVKDGMSSQAYFRLFERLRELRQAKRITAVIAAQAFPPAPRRGPGDFQKVFAETLLAQAPKDGITLVLTGKYPAMRILPASADPPNMPMATYLPADGTITLDAVGHGGTFWACTGANDCGVKPLPASPDPQPRGLRLTSDNPAYSGIMSVGTPLMHSPPFDALVAH